MDSALMQPLSALTATLQEIADTSGAKAKKEILSTLAGSPADTYAQQFFRYSLDPFTTFGVKDLGDDITFGSAPQDEATVWRDWITLLDRLSQRQVTGNAARDEVRALLGRFGPVLGPWALAMFRNDYRIGVSETTVNKVWSGLVKRFGCQLAVDWDGKDVYGEARVEPKFDGVRGLLFVYGGEAPVSHSALSRNGKPLNNVGHILNELASKVPAGEAYVFDGELFNQSWARSMVVRGDEKGDATSQFRAFDIIPLNEFTSHSTQEPLSIRLRRLEYFILGCKHTTYVPGTPVSTAEEALSVTADLIGQGYEGGVMKNLEAPYHFDFGTKKKLAPELRWLKIKEFVTADLKIIGFEEGEGRNEGRLGAFVVEGEHDGTPVARSKVGSMPDAVRDAVWAAQTAYIGKVIEVKFQELTPDRALRFPTFIRFRDDK